MSVHSPERALQHKLERLQESPPIDVGALDFDIQDPERLRTEMGSVFSYFARVESEVLRDGEVLRALLPKMEDAHRTFIYDAWIPQEVAHGQIFDQIQSELGMMPLPVASGSDLKMKAAGLVAKLSPGAHRIFEMVYLSRGAMHETAVMPAYRMMSERLRALGETAIPNIIEDQIVPQEGGHIGYYRMAALQKRKQLSPKEKLIVRVLSEAGYSPVGANSSDNKRHFGEVALTLTGDEPSQLDEFMVTVDRIGDKLLTLDDATLKELSKQRGSRTLLDYGRRRGLVNTPDFALSSVKKCVLEAQSRHF